VVGVRGRAAWGGVVGAAHVGGVGSGVGEEGHRLQVGAAGVIVFAQRPEKAHGGFAAVEHGDAM